MSGGEEGGVQTKKRKWPKFVREVTGEMPSPSTFLVVVVSESSEKWSKWPEIREHSIY